ncbi:ribonuclease H [Trifolium pratense]|uniref:Ribonuclease H n=1 Tax=Trifolium pratense TaxID=57577 RepID=A0A2K3N9B2_TRIPR|nr:ribonuclease H [Trifolium pratense]
MIILSWNCRGLAKPNAVPNHRNLARGHRPDVIFLFETLSNARQLESLRVKLGYESCLSIDVQGHSGGIAVLWKASSCCRVLNYSRNYINLIVEDRDKGNWRLTGFYGYPEHSRRRNSWDMLRDLRDMSLLTWCIIEEITDCGHELEYLRDQNSNIRFRDVREKHANLLIQEEIFWRQRAKMHWPKDGDFYTKFFHQSASVRSKVNKIEKLLNEDGEVVSAGVTYVMWLGVTMKVYNDCTHAGVLDLIQPKITQEDNDFLMASFNKEELRQALFQMHPDKSPGPDGFNLAFYQRFWAMCGDDIFSAMNGWLTRGYFSATLIDTNIWLIPKCDNPTSMKDLRPISLCNVLYKMISKLLANKLKRCLGKCVSEEQPTFLERRSIIDNALVAIEVLHAMKRKTRGWRGDLALKIDISKAYDRVDWGFLRGVLTKLGFDERWIRWMMLCVSSVNYSVLVNFDRVGPISPGRGLRQGDPLSPYLFILVAEGLSTLIHQAVARGEIHEIKICRGAPLVSHLLFADDCFLFCRAEANEARCLLDILCIYAEAFGQQINLSKSEVYMSNNVSQAAKDDLANMLGVRLSLGSGTYLGLTSMIGRSNKAIFTHIKDHIWKRINAWKERMLNAFWWDGGSRNKGICWMALDKLTCTKTRGGMGFRDMKVFNSAMLAKQGYNPSSAWRSIWSSLHILVHGCRWRIGDGSSVRVMGEPWLRAKESALVQAPQRQEIYEMNVKDLMATSERKWDEAKLRMLFDSTTVRHIIFVPLFSFSDEDKLTWKHDRSGMYTV